VGNEDGRTRAYVNIFRTEALLLEENLLGGKDVFKKIDKPKQSEAIRRGGGKGAEEIGASLHRGVIGERILSAQSGVAQDKRVLSTSGADRGRLSMPERESEENLSQKT